MILYTVQKKIDRIGRRLLVNDRFWLLAFGVLLSVFTFISVWQLVPAGELRIIRLQQVYGFIATAYLYSALLASPLTKAFPNMPGREKYLFLRRAIGVSSFYFASLHAVLAFFGQLQGFAGLNFLSGRYIIALVFGVLALFILLLMAATSVDKIIDFMTFRRWKILHRFIYAAGWLIFVHVILIGTHFSGSNSLPGRIVFGAVIFLLLLEALRIDKLLKQRLPRLGHFGLASMLVMHLLFVGFGYLIGRSASFSVQDGHGTTHNASSQTLKQQVDTREVEINQVRFSLNKLVEGSEFIIFRVNPGFEYTDIDCFLIHNESKLYIQGFTKLGPTGEIICAPLGDSQPPFVGYYYAYLHLKGDSTSLSTKFDIDIL